MAYNKPELMLYSALCHADGCSEGDFKIERANDWAIRRYQQAMRTVERYLSSDWGLQQCGRGLVNSEQEAQELIALCQREFEGVIPLIELSHCMHGRIRFNRKALFEHHALADRDNLIERIEKWDYMKQKDISPRKLRSAFYS
jgi:hypothetical protein